MTSLMNRVVVVVCAAGLALACQTQEQATEQGSETSPVVDAAGAREAMAAIDQAWEEAALAGDAAALTALYTADAVVQAPGYPRVSGTAGIQEFFGGMLETPASSLNLDTDIVEVSASGDMIYGVGTYTETGTGPDGAEWTDRGKYMQVLENVDGTWKIAADTWNSDAAEGMESEPAMSEPDPAPSE